MKKILIATDFSANATHAAEYGYRLAKQIKADIVLCNVVIVPAEMPQIGMVAWPMGEYEVLMEGSITELKKLMARLTADTDGFKPAITYVSETGIVTDVINNAITAHKIDFVITGTHGSSGFASFMLGNHNRDMIDHVVKPLILVPATTPLAPTKKIAFATDFTQPKKDLEYFNTMIVAAKLLKAEILLTHIYEEKQDSAEFQNWVEKFIAELSEKANYPEVYYRLVKNVSTENGLDWLCQYGQVDMLVMVHRPHSFFDNLLKGSHTKKMASHINIPLFVFPEKR